LARLAAKKQTGVARLAVILPRMAPLWPVYLNPARAIFGPPSIFKREGLCA